MNRDSDQSYSDYCLAGDCILLFLQYQKRMVESL